MASIAHLSNPAALRPRALALWLFAIAALVFAMVIVGGITRLTESGLSITEWKPITGALPPFGDAAWEAEFDKYRATPEYLLINKGMSLSAFQFIYFWEWAHRLLGRIIGLAFALPLAWFAVRRAIPEGYAPRLVALLLLGGLQGTIGWWMVQSGLVDRTDVSHIRLSVHLLLALFILAGLIWTALDLLRLNTDPLASPARLTPLIVGASAILFIQLLIGAWVAGLNAGQVASSWPAMNGDFVPRGIGWNGISTFVNDPYLTHFLHRWWAWVVVVALVVLARRAKSAGDRPSSIALQTALGFQILLGIATVLSGVAIWLAVLHQAVGALLVAATAWSAHAIARRTAA